MISTYKDYIQDTISNTQAYMFHTIILIKLDLDPNKDIGSSCYT